MNNARSSGRGRGRTRLTSALRLLTAFALAAAAVVTVDQHQAHAAGNQLHGVNWADQRDNFVNGVLYPSGLSSSDTYASATVVADQVIGQLYSITGADTVRIPINEPTVSTFWGTYTGAIDAALSKGNVILAYWAYSSGKPASTSAFNAMWDTVVAKYAGNPNAYFEVINEPYAYSGTDLDNLYNNWLTRYPSVPRGRVILDGTGDAQSAAPVGNDSRLNNTLIAIHDYSFFANYTTESQWAAHLAGEIGSFASRTVVTEWGAPMAPGSKNGVHYNQIDYNVPNTNFFDDYVRGESSEMRTLGIGSVYWPGLRDGDWYSMTTKTGTGAGIKLTLVNASGLDRLQYAWGIGNSGGGGSYDQIRNAATGLCIDGAGTTTNGANAEQSTCDSTNNNQQWTIIANGSYQRIQNRATGLYLDGMGRTANGSAVGQYTSSTSSNQQWTMTANGGNIRFTNHTSGLYIDGMGQTTTGSTLGQYNSSNSTNQQWQLVSAS